MANLIVAGAGGRMGRLLIGLIANDRTHKLVGAVEAAGVSTVGADAGETAGAGSLGVKITADYAALARPDTVTLDFTNAAAALEHLEIASKAGAAIVIGATGFTPEMEGRARELAAKTRTVIAPNMSLGVNVLTKIVAEVAALLPDFDAEVLEIHHRTKVDAPSGTALALGRVVSSLIYGVRPTDPLTFATVASLLIAVGVFATIVPAYRATRVEPIRTLRDE